MAEKLKKTPPQVNPDGPQPLTKSEKRKKIIFLVAALITINLFVFGSLYYSIFKKDQAKKIEVAMIKTAEERNISPTPFPFQEMTIPHLRARGYESELGELEQNAANGSYTSYLTSFDSDGFKVNGQLTIPVGETPSRGWPAIIFVHGYIPPANYQTFSNYSAYVDYLASRGFVVFKIDLRGHGESEGEAGGGYFSSDYVIDALNARAALQKTDYVNPEKIGLWGHSMAGNVVTRALAASPEIPAVVIWSGAVYTYEDMQRFGIDDNSYQPPPEESPNRRKRRELIEKYGEFDPNSEFWKLVPMTNYLDEIKGAIFLNHTIDDPVVSVDYSRNLDRILSDTNIPHELKEYPTGGHNFTGNTFTEAMQNTIEFYDKYLKQ